MHVPEEADSSVTAGYCELMALFQSFDCRKVVLPSLPTLPGRAPTHSPPANQGPGTSQQPITLRQTEAPTCQHMAV